MFEKEAEEYTENPKSAWKQGKTCVGSVRQAFKDGAEFGYNKAKLEVEDSYRESLCNSELNLASVTKQLEELEKANKEREKKCKTAYIKGIRTMANALKNYDRTDGAWTDYFEHTVEEVLKRLLKENE